MGSEGRTHLLLVQQFVSIVRDPVPGCALECSYRPDSGADLRYWGQLWHQDHELSADGGVRPRVEESRWSSDQVGRNAIGAHDLQRARKRAYVPRYACGSRQRWLDYRDHVPPY